MIITALIISFFVILLIFIISSLPLYFAVKFLNGKTTLIKTIFVTFISGIIISTINFKFKLFGSLISFFILIWLYHEVFRLRWIKAILAWFLQFIFIVIFYIIAFVLLLSIIGISVLL